MRDKEIVKQIDRYLNGKLTEEEIDQLWGEFLKNPEYLKLLETEAVTREYFSKEIDEKKQVPVSDAGKKNHQSSVFDYRNWIYGIAAILIVVLLFQFMIIDSRSPLHSELITSISPQEMVTTDLYRSVEQGYAQLDVEISKGYEAAVSGRTDESLEVFSGILESNPMPKQKAVASLNYGILLYNSTEFEAATAAFENVVHTKDLSLYTLEKGWWYLGNALAQIKDYEGARNAVLQAYQLDGMYREDAGKLLEILEERIRELL